MTTHAKSTFEVKSWDESAYDEAEGQPKLTRAVVTFAYHGDLEGLGAMTYLMAYRADGSANVIGLERVSGKLGGKEGTFVLQHRGSYADGTARGELRVVEGSGTGALESLRGQGTTMAKQDGTASFELEYDYA
jgi:hypothetical protein